jgi:glycerol uptake facilitator protein
MTNLLGEFLGTMVLIIFGGGVVANVLLTKSKGQGGGWIVITSGWFVATVAAVYVAQYGGAPNADLNPAVTFAKFLIHHMYTPLEAMTTIVAQIIGTFCGAVFVWLIYLPHWRATDSKIDKLSVFCTSPAIRNYPANLLAEVICSAILVIGIGIVITRTNSGHLAPLLGPYIIGLLIWGIGLSLGGPTGYAINPARDLGPRIAHAILPIPGRGSSDWQYSWIPILGPLLGGILGAFFWKLFLH